MEIKEKEFNKRVGANIRKYRRLYSVDVENITQKELAEKIGVSTALIGAIESKRSTQGISIYNLYKISKVLDVPIGKFFE